MQTDISDGGKRILLYYETAPRELFSLWEGHTHTRINVLIELYAYHVGTHYIRKR